MACNESKAMRIILITAFFGLAGLLFYSGCAQPQGELFGDQVVDLVWPGPPEEARIRFIGTISTETDLKKEVTWSESLSQMIFGKDDTGVLVGPYSVTIDDDDRMYAADSSGGVIQMFDLRGRQYNQFSSISDTENLITPVAVTLWRNDLYVVDSSLGKVCVFNKDGGFLRSIGEGKLKRPSGIACSKATGKIYVADTAAHTICVFDERGRFQFNIGKRGIDAGEFNFPTHLWTDDDDKLYVSDTLNYRIQVFDSEGRFVKMFGKQGDSPGYFAHPCGVATDSNGNIYVTDRQFENFQIFDSEGSILLAIGDEGNGPGQFWLPGGIFIDKKNRIFVADSFNKRIQIFELISQVSKAE
jgi:DNA-binding beta-propeller fold protein YncE